MRQLSLKIKHFLIGLSALTILTALSLSPLGMYLNIEGLIIVVGGSIANAYLSYRKEELLKAFGVVKQMFKKLPCPQLSLPADIKQMIIWSHVVQAHDFMGLEKLTAKKIKDPFTQYGLDLVVTAYSGDKVRDMLMTVADAEFERRTMPVTILRNMAATAPTFGMVGTLIGMIAVMKHMGADASGIGNGLGIAMLATLYGILLARLVCLPAADKLLQMEEATRYRHYMLAEGMAMLAEKQTPFTMQDKLNSFLEPSRHFSLDDYDQLAQHRTLAMAA